MRYRLAALVLASLAALAGCGQGEAETGYSPKQAAAASGVEGTDTETSNPAAAKPDEVDAAIKSGG